MPQNHDSRQGPVPPFYPYPHYYPGVNPYGIKAEASSLVPYSPPSPAPTQAPAASTTPKSGGGLSLPSLGDLKGIVDRMGGIDGILSTMGQVQKVMQTVQQFAPMAKLFTAFLPGGKGKSAGGRTGRMDEYRPRRRKSTRKKSGSRTGSGRSGKRSSTGKSGKSGKSGNRRR
ncbi:hypothetical protein MJ257_07195 [Paenibacillus timonensis]|uniref:Tyrosine protein kinase n=1 Tax=Paenibacillus timonensis TaxID=225915 RepID=A0ABW3S8R9_9BACL|nr:hypothetical protein [Paenibacillus timonensis]MCH1639884.1 hypothetical protein [Paenibacillus timonensis]